MTKQREPMATINKIYRLINRCETVTRIAAAEEQGRLLLTELLRLEKIEPEEDALPEQAQLHKAIAKASILVELTKLYESEARSEGIEPERYKNGIVDFEPALFSAYGVTFSKN